MKKNKNIIKYLFILIFIFIYFPPYEYREGNEILGVDAEIVNAISKDIGVNINREDMKFDSLISALTSNKFDLIVAGMTVTEDR